MSPQLGARLTVALVAAPLIGVGALAQSAAADDSVTVQVTIPERQVDTGVHKDPPATHDLPGTGGPDLGLLLGAAGLLVLGVAAAGAGRMLARDEEPSPTLV